MTDIIPVFLVAVSVMCFVKAKLDWSHFAKKVRQNNFIDSEESKKVAVKIAAISAVSGLTMGLAGVLVGLSSLSNDSEEVSSILYIAYIVSCTVGWTLFALLIFGLNLLSLMSIYKKTQLK